MPNPVALLRPLGLLWSFGAAHHSPTLAYAASRKWADCVLHRHGTMSSSKPNLNHASKNWRLKTAKSVDSCGLRDVFGFFDKHKKARIKRAKSTVLHCTTLYKSKTYAHCTDLHLRQPCHLLNRISTKDQSLRAAIGDLPYSEFLTFTGGVSRMKVAKLDTQSARRQLTARSTPYYNKMRTNLALGLRKRTANSEGIWTARWGNGSTLPYVTESLGDLIGFAPEKRFDEAKVRASRWADMMEARRGIVNDAPKQMITVRQACIDWLAQKRLDGRSEMQVRKSEQSLLKHVYKHNIAEKKLDELNELILAAWVKLVRETPATGRSLGKGVTIKLSPNSVNRIIDPLAASLTMAYERGIVMEKKKWKSLDRDRNGGKARDVYLDIEQRKALLNNARPDAAAFFKGCSLLPFRPGALAKLTVGQFDARRSQLSVGIDKAHKERKLTLHPDTAAFFAEMCEDKLPAAPIFSQADGKPWNSQAWWHAMEDAKKGAGLSNDITLYALRHSTISDLIQYGKLNVYTVASLAGTSPEQIYKHYMHFFSDAAVEAMGKLHIGLT